VDRDLRARLAAARRSAATSGCIDYFENLSRRGEKGFGGRLLPALKKDVAALKKKYGIRVGAIKEDVRFVGNG